MTPYTLNINKGTFKQMRKAVSIIILAAFISTSVRSPAYAQVASVDPIPRMPAPGAMVHLSPEYTPAYLKALIVHPENALRFDFIVAKGDDSLTDQQKHDTYQKLIKYFLASLAVPDENQWVNLSPYEKDRIIKDDFGKTEMGRDLLAQDYLLKQITASLINPEENLGRKFWDRIYAQAYKEYGTTNIPVNTFNKVWIIPDSASVYEHGNMVYVVSQHLKVMLEEDYLSLRKHSGITNTSSNKAHSIGSQVVREIVLPALEKEVNEGRNFAALRQVYSGMILAAWYKYTLKESLLGKIYANKGKVRGVDQDPMNNQKIYTQYLKAFKKGAFNYIKEDVDKYTQETIPRKYFSGGALEADYFGNRTGKGIVQPASQAMVGEDAAIIPEDAAMVDLRTTQEARNSVAPANAAMATPKVFVDSNYIHQLKESVPVKYLKYRISYLVGGPLTGLARDTEGNVVVATPEVLLISNVNSDIYNYGDTLGLVKEGGLAHTIYFSDVMEWGLINIHNQLVRDDGNEYTPSPTGVFVRTHDGLYEIYRNRISFTSSSDHAMTATGPENELRIDPSSSKDLSLNFNWAIFRGGVGGTVINVLPQEGGNIKVLYDENRKEIFLNPNNLQFTRGVTTISLTGRAGRQGLRISNNSKNSTLTVLKEELKNQAMNVITRKVTLGLLAAGLLTGPAVVQGWAQRSTYHHIYDSPGEVTFQGGMAVFQKRVEGAEYQLLIDFGKGTFYGDKIEDHGQKLTAFPNGKGLDPNIKKIFKERIEKSRDLTDVQRTRALEILSNADRAMTLGGKIATGALLGLTLLGTSARGQQPTTAPLSAPQEASSVKTPVSVTFLNKDKNGNAVMITEGKTYNYETAASDFGGDEKVITKVVVESLIIGSDGMGHVTVTVHLRDVSKDKERGGSLYILGPILRDFHPPPEGLTEDKATVTNPNNLNSYGGIDFNAANLNLQIKRDGHGVPLPISQQDLQNIKIDGLVPVIIDIKPATSLPIFADLQSTANSVNG